MTTLTEKENYMRVIHGEEPEWIPRFLYPSPGKPAACTWLGPAFLNERRTKDGGFDIWGVEFISTVETGYQSLPVPGKFMFEDITKWRDYVHAPDISGFDWEQMAHDDLKNIDRTQTAITSMTHVGYFQQLCNFMGFTAGLCALIEEPEEVRALYDYLADFYNEIERKTCEYYKPDMFGLTDDTATAMGPFISLDTYHDVVMPYHERDASIAREYGVPIDMHNCGRCEDFIPDWLKMGVCCWNPAQQMNDLDGIKAKYGNKLVLTGCWDSQGPAGWPGATEETVKAEVRRICDAYAPGGGFVFWASSYGAPDDQDFLNKQRWITEEYDAYGRTWYQTH